MQKAPVGAFCIILNLLHMTTYVDRMYLFNSYITVAELAITHVNLSMKVTES